MKEHVFTNMSAIPQRGYIQKLSVYCFNILIIVNNLEVSSGLWSKYLYGGFLDKETKIALKNCNLCFFLFP